MSSAHRTEDFQELEAELLKDTDAYEREIREKIDRRRKVSNFLEGKD